MKLTPNNHKQMESLIGKILDAQKDGTVSRDCAIGALAHIIAAAANDEADEVLGWLTKPDTFENWFRTASTQK